MPSELLQHRTPIPTQIVSSDEFYPDPQNERQREVEARMLAMADDLGGKQGLDRRRFFQSAAGMAAAFGDEDGIVVIAGTGAAGHAAATLLTDAPSLQSVSTVEHLTLPPFSTWIGGVR